MWVWTGGQPPHPLTEDVDLLLSQTRPTCDPPQIDQGLPKDPERNFGTDLKFILQSNPPPKLH